MGFTAALPECAIFSGEGVGEFAEDAGPLADGAGRAEAADCGPPTGKRAAFRALGILSSR